MTKLQLGLIAAVWFRVSEPELHSAISNDFIDTGPSLGLFRPRRARLNTKEFGEFTTVGNLVRKDIHKRRFVPKGESSRHTGSVGGGVQVRPAALVYPRQK